MNKASIKSNNTEYDKDDMTIYVRKWISLLLYNSIYIALHRYALPSSSFIILSLRYHWLHEYRFISFQHFYPFPRNLMFSLSLSFVNINCASIACVCAHSICFNIHVHHSSGIYNTIKMIAECYEKLVCEQCYGHWMAYIGIWNRKNAFSLNWVVTNWATWKMGLIMLNRIFNGNIFTFNDL